MFLIRQMTPQAAGSQFAERGEFRSWATASFDGGTDTSPMELSALGAHVDRCNGSRGRMFALRCAVDALHGFIAPRFVTTLVVITLVFGVGSLVL